jgi:hypothetical protein
LKAIRLADIIDLGLLVRSAIGRIQRSHSRGTDIVGFRACT